MNAINGLPGFSAVAFRQNTQNNFSRQNICYNNALSYDKFEKSTNSISFSGNNAFQQKIDKAADLFEEHIMNEQFSTERISEIVGEFSDEIDVEKFNHSKCDNAQDATIGYLKAPIGFTQDGRAVLLGRTLCITPPRDDSYEEKLRVLKNTVHEFTHAMQFDDPQKSKLVLLERYTRNHPVTNKRNLNTVVMSSKIAASVEANLINPIAASFKKTNNLPVPVNDVTIKGLDKMFRGITGQNTEDCIKFVINRVIAMAEMQTGSLDRDFILSYIDLLAKTEKEAYEQDIKVSKKVSGINGNADLDYIPLVYEQISKTIQKMRK